MGPDLKPVIDRWADYVSHRQFRLADGTLARTEPQPDSIWADDMYMSVPFLAQMGKLTGDTRYYDDAARQVLQISGRLFVWNHAFLRMDGAAAMPTTIRNSTGAVPTAGR